MDKRYSGEEWWQYRFWGNKITTRIPVALIAAVFLLSVPVQPRAQTTDEVTSAEESVAAVCPCGNPAELVPVATWPTTAVDCAADTTRTTVYCFSNEGGVASLVSTSYGRDCQFIADANDLNSQERPITQSEVKACSVLILDYAQALKDAGRVEVHDFGCNLK